MKFPVSAKVATRGVKLGALGLIMVFGMGLTACASATPEMAARFARPRTATPVSYAQPSADAVTGGRYKLGAPYQANGIWFVPAEQDSYDSVGLATTYGDNLDGKPTANGEIFDAKAASGAHATLPMPSIVEVTNLETSKTTLVRLNDRGATAPGAIINLSRGASEALGLADRGGAKVRVRYVGPARLDETLEPLFVANAARTDAVPQPRPQATPVVSEPRELAPPPAKPAQPAPLPAGTTVAAASSVPPAAASAWTRAQGAAGQGPYAVQAGAFSDRARAEKVAEQLSAAGAAAVRPIEVAGRQLYRVVVGPWSDQDEAQAGRAQVASLGFADARVIKAF